MLNPELICLCVLVGLLLFNNANASEGLKYPGWLTRTEFSYNIKRADKPTWALETVQSLSQTPETLTNSILMQGKLAFKSHDQIFNIGAGYRFLAPNNNYIIGVNTFLDKTFQYNHRRSSLGIEYYTPYIFYRGNYYHAESKNRTIVGNPRTQRALSGWDIEAETPFPYMPWVRFAFNVFHWHTQKAVKQYGYTPRVNLSVSKNLRVEIGRAYDHKTSPKLYCKLNWVFTQKTNKSTLSKDGWFDTGVFAKYKLEEHTLGKIRRYNNIVTE